MMNKSKQDPQNSKLDVKNQNSISKSNIDTIKKTNAAMRDELNAEARLSSMTNAQTGSKIAKLQEKGTFYAKQIEVEAKKLHDLERQIDIVQASVNDKRAKLQKVEGTSSDSLGKEIKKLERTLDKTLQKHNEILAENRQLKEEIDHLRRERVTFDKIYKKLEGELQDKKKTLCEVFESSEKAKERKNKIEDQIKNLKLRIRKEETNIEKEFQDIFKDINEKNVVDRIEEKFGPLKERASPLKKRDAENTNVLEESVGEEDISRATMRKGAKSIEKRPKELAGKTPQEEVEEYNAIFDSLKKKTHKNDLKEILALFQDYESKNYSLYQHLTHLSDEKEDLEKQIHHIKEEIGHLTQSQQKENVEDEKDSKAQKIQELKKDIEESDQHFHFLENKQSGLTETINALKISIPIIFERIGCNIEDYANELIDGTTVNEGNMLQYLAIIEKKTNEILQMYHFSQNKSEAGQKNNMIEEKNRKIIEDSNISASPAFPAELINDLILASAPERADMQTEKDFQNFAKGRIEGVGDKKSSKSGNKQP
jgi:chromosome segregation ATPase